MKVCDRDLRFRGHVGRDERDRVFRRLLRVDAGRNAEGELQRRRGTDERPRLPLTGGSPSAPRIESVGCQPF